MSVQSLLKYGVRKEAKVIRIQTQAHHTMVEKVAIQLAH